MSSLLEAVAAERQALHDSIAGRLAVLDEIEQLAQQLGAPATKKTTAPARAPKRASIPSSDDVLSALRSRPGEWMSRVEIAADVGEFPVRFLKTFVNRGVAEAEGSTHARRYRAVLKTLASGGGTAAGRPAARSDGTAQGLVLEALGYRAMSVDELSRQLKIGVADVTTACDALLIDGDIAHGPDGRYRSA